MSTSLTLNMVEQDFSQWRKNRNNRTDPIPEELWHKVATIRSKYKNSEICSRLRLSGTQFKAKAVEESQLSSPNTTTFVTAVPSVPAVLPSIVTLSLSSKNRKLELSVDLAKLDCVLPHLAELL